MTDYLVTLGLFEKAIDRGFGHVRSAELDHAVDAIKRYIKDGKKNDRAKNKTNIERVNQTLGKWQRLNPKECANRGGMSGPLHDGLKTELDEHMARWGGQSAAATAEGTTTWTPGTVRTWIEEKRRSLELLGSYACGDLKHGQPRQPPPPPGVRRAPQMQVTEPDWTKGFAACANPAKRAEIWSRYKNNVSDVGGAQSGILIGRSWKGAQFKGAFTTVTAAKRGVCTTFAQSAAHVLSDARAHGPRVEIVSWGNNSVGHVFVLVDRRGGYATGDKIPDTWVDEPNVVIVDAWRGSLGWDTISFGKVNYRSGMVKGLTCVGEKVAW